MDNVSNRGDLASRYERLKSEGLVNSRVLVRNRDEATTPQLRRELEAMYDALERNDAWPLQFNDRTINS